jgi:hypothetical protein
MIDDNMEGWAIVVTNGMRLVGRWKSAIWETGKPRTLSPVFELLPVQMIAQGPRNPPQIVFAGTNANSPLGYDCIESLEIPEGALVVPVSTLSAADRTALANGIDGFEKLRAQARSNIVVPSAGAAAAINGQAAKLVRG